MQMQDSGQQIFISYAWGGEREKIVDQIDQALQQRGLKITRDKRDLGYKGSIKEFMERIGRGNCVIVVVSDKYLRSANCMFELVEIAENKQFHDRVFPVVLADANIYDPIKRIEYVKYWEIKRAELAEAMKTLDPANLQGIRDDMDLYDRIRDKISSLTSILKDMNTLTPEMHQESDFGDLYDAMEKRLRESPTNPTAETLKDEKAVEETSSPAKGPVGGVNAGQGGIAIGNFQVGGNTGNISIGNSSGSGKD
jgi:internalin A